MAKADQPPVKSDKKAKKSNLRWVLTIFILTIIISAAISFLSTSLMEMSGIATAFLILLFIVFLGIIFDIIGVAATSAVEKPFHSMAAKKVPGAAESIHLLRNAEKVASICNDVVGDICGVVSGTAAAIITTRMLAIFDGAPEQVLSLVLSALVAGLTVGGKAIGKTIAIRSCTSIVFTTGKIIHWFSQIPQLLRLKKRKK